jgi:hypothetical protein
VTTATRAKPPAPQAPLYERDFLAWTEEQAALLRAGRITQVDLSNLIEEVESLGASQKAAVDSQMVRLLMHLLKWVYQPTRRTKSWRVSIIDARRQVEIVLTQSPSVRHYIRAGFMTNYNRARADARHETKLPTGCFPEAPPFTLEQVLDDDFWPE